MNCCAASRHHDLHIVAALHQRARQFRGLIRRDAAAHAQDDPHAGTPDGLLGVGYWLAVARRVSVMHQAAAHFFHRHHGGLLIGGWQNAPLPALQLARALGGDDDEAVRALLRIVRDRVRGSWVLVCSAIFELHSFLKQTWRLLFKDARMGRIWSSIRIRRDPFRSDQ